MAQKIDGKWSIGTFYYIYTDDGIDGFWMPLAYKKDSSVHLESIIYFLEEDIWFRGEEQGEDAVRQIESINEFEQKPSTEDLLIAAKKIEKSLPIEKWETQWQEFIRFCFRML